MSSQEQLDLESALATNEQVNAVFWNAPITVDEYTFLHITWILRFHSMNPGTPMLISKQMLYGMQKSFGVNTRFNKVLPSKVGTRFGIKFAPEELGMCFIDLFVPATKEGFLIAQQAVVACIQQAIVEGEAVLPLTSFDSLVNVDNLVKMLTSLLPHWEFAVSLEQLHMRRPIPQDVELMPYYTAAWMSNVFRCYIMLFRMHHYLKSGLIHDDFYRGFMTRHRDWFLDDICEPEWEQWHDMMSYVLPKMSRDVLLHKECNISHGHLLILQALQFQLPEKVISLLKQHKERETTAGIVVLVDNDFLCDMLHDTVGIYGNFTFVTKLPGTLMTQLHMQLENPIPRKRSYPQAEDEYDTDEFDSEEGELGNSQEYAHTNKKRRIESQ